MDSYRTEEEQIEAIKNWWKKNGVSTLGSIAVAVALVFGWQAWQKSQLQDAGNASALYQEMMIADQKVADNAVNLANVHHLADQLKTEYSNSVYADYASLLLVKHAVESGDLERAETELSTLLDDGSIEEIEQLAQLRLARVLFAQDKTEEALGLLNSDKAGSFAALYEETKGDIYVSTGEQQQALDAFEKALELTVASGIRVEPLLQMKIDELVSVIPQSAEEEK